MDEKNQEEVKTLPREPLDLPLPHKELPVHEEREDSALPQQQIPFQDQENQHEVKTLLSWQAPGRPYQARGREYFLNILVIMLAVEVILFLFSEYMLMLVVGALVFLTYALNRTPPHDFHYRLTTEGVRVEDHFFLWQELYDFYFKHVGGKDVLHISTKAFLPGELIIVLGDMDKEHVKSIMLPYLPFREYVKPTFMERSGEWLSRTFPLDKQRTIQN